VKWAAAHGNITTSPTVLGDRLYVGTADGRVLALDTEADGAKVWELSTLDGPVKRFVMIDRANPVVYFSTARRVWKVQDTGADPPPVEWATPPSGAGSISSPSTPILYGGTARLYVGSGDGKLHVLHPASGADDVPPIPLGDTLATVGSPTIDTRLLRIYVGSEAGVIYKVQFP
jgi:outer membrane protein assembly factor BamB